MAIGVAGHRQPNRMEIGRRSRGRVEGNPTKFKSAFWATVATKHSNVNVLSHWNQHNQLKIWSSFFYGDFGGVPKNQLKALIKFLHQVFACSNHPTRDEKLPASWKGFWSSIRASWKWLLRCQAKKISTKCVYITICLCHFTYSRNWMMSAILRMQTRPSNEVKHVVGFARIQ